MRTVLTVALAALLCAAEPAKPPAKSDAPKPPEFTIDDWSFTWTVAKPGDAQLRIEKTPDTTLVRVSKRIRSVRLTPAEAEAIAPVLAKADDYAARLRGKDDADETVTVGRYSIMFQQSARSGFGLYLSAASGIGGVALDRGEAKALAAHMLKAKRMAAFLDARIRF